MASMSVCGSATRSPSLINLQPIHRPNLTLQTLPKLSSSSLSFGIKGVLRWKTGPRRFVTFASDSNTPGAESSKEKPGTDTSESEVKGPPFLTILAGFFTLFIVIGIIGSIIMWLIGLIVNLCSK